MARRAERVATVPEHFALLAGDQRNAFFSIGTGHPESADLGRSYKQATGPQGVNREKTRIPPDVIVPFFPRQERNQGIDKGI